MKVIVPGHKYLLNDFEPVKDSIQKEGENTSYLVSGQYIGFIHKEPVAEGSTEYQTVENGTTNEEVIEMLINRLNYLQNEHQGGKFKCKANACTITHLEEALHWLNARTFERMKRGVEGKHVI